MEEGLPPLGALSAEEKKRRGRPRKTDLKIPEPEPVLSEEQKEEIRKYWDENHKAGKEPSLKDIVRHICGEDTHFASKFGRVVRKFIADNLFVKPERLGPVSVYELTLQEKEFLDKNRRTQSPMELIRTLFADDPDVRQITQYHPKGKAVIEYLRLTKGDEEDYIDPNSVPTEKYYAPKSIPKAITKINKALHNSVFLNCENLTAKEIEQNLKPKEKQCVLALIKYLNDTHFVELMNSYKSERERTLLESTLIKYLYDKPDLAAEEVEQYVTLSNETIIGLNIQAHINKLQEILDNDAEGEDAKFRMGLVEAISSGRSEYNQSVSRKEKLLSALVTKRSKKLEEKVSESQSLVNLIEFWKSAKRNELIKQANLRKSKLKDEVKRLETLDDLKFEIFGLDPTEILNS